MHSKKPKWSLPVDFCLLTWAFTCIYEVAMAPRSITDSCAFLQLARHSKIYLNQGLKEKVPCLLTVENSTFH